MNNDSRTPTIGEPQPHAEDSGGLEHLANRRPTVGLELVFRHRSDLVLLLILPIVALSLTSPMVPVYLGVGLTLLVAGAALRLWAARCLGKGARVHNARARDGIVDWGPYAWSRNPLYVAAGLILAGFACLSGGGWWGLLLLPATCVVYIPVVLHEERAIGASEGEAFVDYTHRVSRWIGLPRASASADAPRYPWKNVFRREVGLIPGLAIGAGGILLTQLGILPFSTWAEWVNQHLGLGVLFMSTIPLAAVAVVNSFLIERKFRRKRAFRLSRLTN